MTPRDNIMTPHDNRPLSECCQAPTSMSDEYGICPTCKEHCEFVDPDDPDPIDPPDPPDHPDLTDIDFVAMILKTSQDLVREELKQTGVSQARKPPRSTQVMTRHDEYEVWRDRARQALIKLGVTFNDA